MTPLDDEKRRPSVEEFNGWYNIRHEYGDGLPILKTTDDIPDFESGEFYRLFLDEDEWFKQLVTAPAGVDYDPVDDPPIFVRNDADDRTLAIDAQFERLTPAILRRVQNEFLGRHPLWRVVFVAEVPSLSIVVYPDAIRFGNSSSEVDPERALHEIIQRQVELREKRLQPQRAQMAIIKRALPDAIQAIGNSPFCVACVIDNYLGDYRRLTMCVMAHGEHRYLFDVDNPPGTGSDFMQAVGHYDVNRDGKIIPEVPFQETPPFCFVLRLPPAEYRGPLTIRNSHTGASSVFELNSASIMRTRLSE